MTSLGVLLSSSSPLSPPAHRPPHRLRPSLNTSGPLPSQLQPHPPLLYRSTVPLPHPGLPPPLWLQPARGSERRDLVDSKVPPEHTQGQTMVLGGLHCQHGRAHHEPDRAILRRHPSGRHRDHGDPDGADHETQPLRMGRIRWGQTDQGPRPGPEAGQARERSRAIAVLGLLVGVKGVASLKEM